MHAHTFKVFKTQSMSMAKIEILCACILLLCITQSFGPVTPAHDYPSSALCKVSEEPQTTGVFYPNTVSDIVHLIKSSYASSSPFKITARGQGHSIGGLRKDGMVIVEMGSLINSVGIKVCGSFVDVGGEQLWLDVLRTTVKYGSVPGSWTDYLGLSAGGTLSNAGISGQTARYGPQISNVVELDVITGTGDFKTCSKSVNPDLFYGVLGGLGQFGIMTRARIALEKAPTRVKWVRIIYENFATFTNDQEHLISLHDHEPNYVEGALIMKKSPANSWRSTFFSIHDESKVNLLASEHGIVYSLDVVKYYDEFSIRTIDEEVDEMLNGLSYKPGFIFKKDVTFVDFLSRVKVESKGSWDIDLHPWLNLFVPKSRILDFNQYVFIDIILRENKSSGPFLVYPMNRKRWDEKTSAVISEEEEDEDIFYTVGLLHTAKNIEDAKIIENQNKKILKVCDEMGIKIKQYLPQYSTKDEWMNHFGKKWSVFEERKMKYDPKMILSHGHNIFNHD